MSDILDNESRALCCVCEAEYWPISEMTPVGVGDYIGDCCGDEEE